MVNRRSMFLLNLLEISMKALRVINHLLLNKEVPHPSTLKERRSNLSIISEKLEKKTMRTF